MVDRRTLVSRDTNAANSESFYTYYDRSSAFVTSDAAPSRTASTKSKPASTPCRAAGCCRAPLSDTIDPKDTRTAVTQIAKAVGAELRKEKLLR